MPQIRFMPAIIQFFCYNPPPEANGWGERLVQHRTTLGLSQKEAAKGAGVDPSTLAKWEQGEKEPGGEFARRLEQFIDGEVENRPASRRAG